MNLDILRRCVDELEQFQAKREEGTRRLPEITRTINHLKRVIKNNEEIDKIQLAGEIRDFLGKHGKRNASEPNEWNSPDASQLEIFALALERNSPLLQHYRPDSSWLHGGYAGGDKAACWHNELIAKIDLFLSKQK